MLNAYIYLDFLRVRLLFQSYDFKNTMFAFTLRAVEGSWKAFNPMSGCEKLPIVFAVLLHL